MLRTYLINLDRSPDRLRFMQEQADRIGLQFERVSGIDGLALPAEMRSEFLNSAGAIASKLKPNEVGCYASHLKVCDRILAEQLPYALVLEDDGVLPADLIGTITEAVQTCPSGWDMIHVCGGTKHKVIPLEALGTRRFLVRHTRLPVSLMAYVLSASGARKFRRPGPRVRPVDMDIRYAYLRRMNIFGVHPAVVSQNSPLASITDPTAFRASVPKGTWRPGMLSQIYGEFDRRRKVLAAQVAVAMRGPRGLYLPTPSSPWAAEHTAGVIRRQA